MFDRPVSRRALPVMLVCGLLAGIGVARADTTLTYGSADGPYTVAITDSDVRIDGNGAEWQLYRADDPAILSVTPDDHSYTRLDRDTAGQIRQQMDALRSRIEQRLQGLPQSKRVAARLAMYEQIPGLNASSQVGLDKTGGHDTVAGVPCDIYQIVRDGQPASTMCVASARALGMDAASFKTVKSMFALLQDMLKGTGLEGIGLPYRSLSGMPVRFTDGVSGVKRTLASISHASVPDSRFTIPKSYVERQPQAPTAQ